MYFIYMYLMLAIYIYIYSYIYIKYLFIFLYIYLVIAAHNKLCEALRNRVERRIRGKFVGNQPAKDRPKEPRGLPTNSNKT